MVIMLSYFYKAIKYKTWKSSVKNDILSNIANIQTSQYPLLMFSLD